MAKKKKPKKPRDKGNVQLETSLYRTLILDKIRAEIQAKRAALEIAKTADPRDLANLAYWKMKYWKMKYWKMGIEINPGGDVINPVARGDKGET